MAESRSPPRLNINPGEYYFGSEYPLIYTLLGSCIAVTCWHPKFLLGGMCHYVVPNIPEEKLPLPRDEVGRYGDSALAALTTAMRFYGSIHRFHIGVFGGSDTLQQFRVGERNIHLAQAWIAQLQIKPKMCDLGGQCSRSLLFNSLTGEIKVTRHSMDPSN